MQSSRRKRERVENDRQDPAAGLSLQSRGRGRANKRLQVSLHDDDGDNNEPVSLGDAPAQAQALSIQSLSQGVTTTTAEGADGAGNDHSETIQNQSTAISAPQVDANANGDASRTKMPAEGESSPPVDAGDSWEVRIAALILHRKIVLERIRQCRIAAQSRMKDIEEKQKSLAAKDATKPDAELKQASDDDEVVRYRETCRLAAQANQAAKKQKAEANGGVAEKRVSVSLRRGASVGKRMQTAISSLTGAPGPSSLPQAPVHPNRADSISPIPPTAIKSAQASSPNSKQAAFKSSLQRLQPSSSGTQSASALQTAQKYSGYGQKNKRASVGQKSARTFAGANSSSTTSSQVLSVRPLHSSTGSSVLPLNPLASSAVRFPEAQALREKRVSIRSKLTAIIEERAARMETTDGGGSSSKRQLLVSSATVNAKVQPKQRHPVPKATGLERGAYSPSTLPRRRKTHWDYILEEMRWLATDFVEERKWKAASARTLSTAVLSKHLTAVTPIAAGAERDKKATCSEEENGRNEVSQIQEAAGTATGTDKSSDKDRLHDGMGDRTYEHPSASDVKLVFSTAKIISDMIAELWDGTQHRGTLSTSRDEPLMAALARHTTMRKSLEMDGSKSESISPQPAENRNGESGIDTGNAATFVESKERITEYMQVDGETPRASLSADEISEQIEKSIERVKSRTTRRSRSKSLNEGIALGEEQRKAIDFIEFIWGGHDMAGSVLDGPISSGKTVAACSMLWRHRSEGPQVLVCSPASVIRWTRELERFEDLAVCLFGLRCGVASSVVQAKTVSEFRECHVVLCEFSSLLEPSLDLSVFSTIVVDTRFFVGVMPEGNRTKDSRSPVKNGVKDSADSLSGQFVPPELVSHTWWELLLTSLRRTQAHRLLIDNHESGFLRERDRLDVIGLTDRQRLDTLAAMVAFVVGPPLFICESARSPQHKVVSWAKHCAKEGSQAKRPQLEEIRSVLVDATFPFRYTLDDDNEVFGAEPLDEQWDVRCCALSDSQRSAYEKCCIGVRGALSLRSITDHLGGQHRPESCQDAVEALLRLRRVCVHSRLDQVLLESCLSGDSSSASQPQLKIAANILSDSAKLRELIIILRDECGFNVHEDVASFQADKGGKKFGSKKKSTASKTPERKKVAILAVLPEVQLLTSILLNAVGIRHELLAATLFHDEGSQPSGDVEKLMHAASTWIKSQMSLWKFCSEGSTDDDDIHANSWPWQLPSCEIIVSSPVGVGAENGGLSIEGADVVICLDEDWSGRDSLFFERILKRSLFAHEMKSVGCDKEQECRFVRLVCEKTCEQVFLDEAGDSDETDLVWPSNGLGFLTLPSHLTSLDIPLETFVPDKANLEGSFRFPGRNLLRYRGATLSTILAASVGVPTDFVTGDAVQFLPFQDWEKKRAAETKETLSIGLLRSLLAYEDSTLQPSSMHCSLAQRRCLRFSLSNGAIQPIPSEFPSRVVTRHDMMAISTRLYIIRFGDYLSAFEGSISSLHTNTNQLLGPSFAGTEDARTAITADHGNVADAWHKSGLSCKPGDIVSELLSYNPSRSGVHSDSPARVQKSGKPEMLGGEHEPGVQAVLSTNDVSPDDIAGLKAGSSQTIGQRVNGFSSAYCLSREIMSGVIKDGHHGCEPLPYFPPLFPSLLGASQQALADLSHYAQPRVLLARDAGSRKRNVPIGAAFPAPGGSKRLRLENAPSTMEKASPRTQHPPQAFSRVPDVAGIASSIVDATVPGLDFFGKVGDGYKAKDHLVTEPSVVTEDEASQWDHTSLFLDVGEDYGLLGIGALSPRSDAARDAALVSVGSLAYAHWRDPYEAEGLDQEMFSSTTSCDPEEVEAYSWGKNDDTFLDTMLLFVTKRQRAPPGFMGMSGAMAVPSGGRHYAGASAAWAQSKTSSNFSSAAMAYAMSTVSDGKVNNGSGIVKKNKKKNQGQGVAPVGAFARVNPTDLAGRSLNPYAGQSALHQAKGKECYRSKVLSTILARQGGRSTLFQVPSFLLASIRIRDDVLRRVLRASGELAPRQLSSHNMRTPWTRACFRLASSAKTGDPARLMSQAQRRLMQDSPLLVDFGPFAAGCVSVPCDVTGSTSSTAKVGASLPLGVKVSRRSGSQPGPPWDENDDLKLKECVFRYGFNWHLVSDRLHAFNVKERKAGSGKSVATSQSRSPGQCHERWRYLVKSKPALAEEFRVVERERRKNAISRPTLEVVNRAAAHRVVSASKDSAQESLTKKETLSLLLPSGLVQGKKAEDENMTVDESNPDAPKTQVKRSFSAFRAAARKKVVVRMPILGYVNGDKPSLVPSHPSHDQVVQAAAASSGGRSEMWPLQILDLADKQRAARHSAGIGTPGSGSRQSSGAAATFPPTPQAHQSSPARQPKRPNNNYPQAPGAPGTNSVLSPSKSPSRFPSQGIPQPASMTGLPTAPASQPRPTSSG